MNRWWMGMALASGVIFGAADASACLNGVETRVVPVTQLVARAASALARERPVRAVDLVRRARNRIQRERGTSRSRRLRIRSKRILAEAILRLDGSVDIERYRYVASMDRAQRQTSLRWALGILEHAYASNRGPVTTALYAEALGHFPSERARARTLLSHLHAADVMPGAHAYHAFAEATDDPDERAEAIAACRARAGTSRSICTLRSPGDG